MVIGVSGLAMLGGCGQQRTPSREAQKLSLELVPSGRQRPDRVVLKATVTNNTDSPLAWDREFCIFLSWRLSADGQDLRPEYLESLPPPAPAELHTRFVVLDPGHALSREIELTRGFRLFASGHSTRRVGVNGAFVHQAFANEEIARYRIPEALGRVTVSLDYCITFDGSRGFYSWFGDNCETLPFWDGGIVHSNELNIRFK